MRAWLAWTWVLGLTLACHSSHPPETPPPADAGYVFPYSLPLCTGPEEQPVTLTLESYVPLATPSSWNRGASSSELEPGPAQDERRRTLVPDTDGEQPPPLDLYDVWAVSPTDVWVVGAQGTAAHFDGTQWTATPTGTEVDLHGVSALGPTDAWAVGDQGVVLHWDGLSWSRVETGTSLPLWDVWSGAGERAVVVGGNGVALRWQPDGGWQVLPGAEWTLTAVWGAGPEDLWALSRAGTVVHWLNGAVEDLDTPSPVQIVSKAALWGTQSPQGLLAAGQWRSQEGLWHHVNMHLGDQVQNVQGWRGVWQSPTGEVWLALTDLYYAGEGYEESQEYVANTTGNCWRIRKLLINHASAPLRYLLAIHGAGEHDVWSVGSRGLIFHLRY